MTSACSCAGGFCSREGGARCEKGLDDKCVLLRWTILPLGEGGG